MNAITIKYLVIIISIALLTLVFSWGFKKETVSRFKDMISWLLNISYFDFVKLIIFIKPAKKYSIQIGIIIWIILVLVIGNYLIVTQPKINEIAGPFIPMIGYVFYLSILFIIHFMLMIHKKTEQ